MLKRVRLYCERKSAGWYRRILSAFGKTVFVGVTGSCGKTTATELIAAILSKHGRVRKCSHENTLTRVCKTILSVRPWDDFCVSELGTHGPGSIDEMSKLLRPDIGVVTNVGQDHYSSFRSLEATAAEKGKLLENLRKEGTAIINADDPYVLKMRDRTKARVITYGLSEGAMVPGENVRSQWPSRMSLDVCYDGKRTKVQSQLVGEHWAGVVLAGIAVGIAAGVSLELCVEAVEEFEPMVLRMSPYETADGITFISDSWKAPLWAIDAAIDFLRKAKADRKILVIGSISDTPRSFYERNKVVIRQAVDVVDKIIFFGDNAHSALRGQADRKSTSMNSSHRIRYRMTSAA